MPAVPPGWDPDQGGPPCPSRPGQLCRGVVRFLTVFSLPDCEQRERASREDCGDSGLAEDVERGQERLLEQPPRHPHRKDQRKSSTEGGGPAVRRKGILLPLPVQKGQPIPHGRLATRAITQPPWMSQVSPLFRL